MKDINPDEFYQVDEWSFSIDNLTGAVDDATDCMTDSERIRLWKILKERWPVEFGKAIKTIIKNGHDTPNLKNGVKMLFNEDTYFALSKPEHIRRDISYFTAQFARGQGGDLLKEILKFRELAGSHIINSMSLDSTGELFTPDWMISRLSQILQNSKEMNTTQQEAILQYFNDNIPDLGKK